MTGPSSPTASPTAVVVTIGDELLAGETVDTNKATLAAFATAHGFSVTAAHTLPDDLEAIARLLSDLIGRCRLCLVCGGLGPTSDDVTRHAVARACGRPLRRNPALVEDLEAKFARLGRSMPEANLVQADVPEGAEILANPIGTAAGFVVGDATTFAVLPGPPRELARMLHHELAPRMSALGGGPPRPTRRYRCLGFGESSLAARLEPRLPELEGLLESGGVRVRYRAAMPLVDVTFVLDARPSGEVLDAMDRIVAEALAPALYGIGMADLPTRVLAALRQHGHTLATAESCTGGRVAAQITAVPGASSVFAGGVVAYANRIKTALLGVSEEDLARHGAVSEQVARAMADGARACLRTDFAISTTGIAGPAGGSPEKPVGTVWVGIATPDGTDAKRLSLRGERQRIQHAAALWGLKLLWDRLVAMDLARVEVLDGQPAPAPPL
ncbi:MAG: CinA family nicotinamide mononucleotide deamidase-related protein [Deltaproteobacteria bacterium]|nr:MAG: CinA family nicotinamide mononucleotide deamidase-related protein [Deltaproteobacteria bacterium]